MIRDILLDVIRKDVFGPYEENEELTGANHPTSKYLSGVLYPMQTPLLSTDAENSSVSIQSPDDKDEEEILPINVGTKPSSMGITCSVSSNQKSVQVIISYARYEKINFDDGNLKSSAASKKPIDYKWKRVPYCKKSEINLDGGKRLELESKIFFRYFVIKNKNHVTINAFITNEHKYESNTFADDSECIFQPKVRLESADSSKIFLNISKNMYCLNSEAISNLSSTEQEELFLFRNSKHFAHGRNCSVEWNVNEFENKTNYVQTTFVPHYVIPEIKPRKGSEFNDALNMLKLSKITKFKDYDLIFQPIIKAYSDWIEELVEQNNKWRNTNSKEKLFMSDSCNIPQERINECRTVLERIKNGVKKISTDRLSGEAFRFTNEVMYENMTHSMWAKDNRKRISDGKKIITDGPDSQDLPYWRLFQLAFLLLTIESITDPKSDDRNIADLLWFPTGGGKTEAYFGVIAFTMAHRRLRNAGTDITEKEHDRYGITIIMRYTYRLLTLQQFQRAATLFCACEYVRMKNMNNKEKFGEMPFLVGLWVGYNTTPNDFVTAKKIINDKRNGIENNETSSDPMQLLDCPWCGRQLTPYNYKIESKGERIQIKCDPKCFFGKPNDPERVIPVVFIDQDIRRFRPSLLLSTVDKFAQISWNWEYSALFGNVSKYCEEHGYSPGNAPNNYKGFCKHDETSSMSQIIKRNLDPPELIIQDELHLITGPLGTLTGLYETAIDILCTTKSGIRPKIIASTATTKQSNNQITLLFNSKSTKIFPPSGFQFGESYFAQVFPISEEHPGKMYVGVCSTSVSGSTAESRLAACIMRKIREIRENQSNYEFNGNFHKFTDFELDQYYTLVSYYNTIKSLGGGLRLYQDTIPRFMGTIRETVEKTHNPKDTLQNEPDIQLNFEELTGRKNASEIPNILKNIEKTINDDDVLDALLCTNMLSVGVDIDRLNVMLMNGQPKSTSEYIQATGRIGRKNPGIVVTNYSYMRARDLSYFENFIDFHSIYHKNVEPGILTPFSTRARDRGLSGVFIALARLNNKQLSKDPKNINIPQISEVVSDINEKILKRIAAVDPTEQEGAESDLNNIVKKWKCIVTSICDPKGKNPPKLGYRRSPRQKYRSGPTYLLNSPRDPYKKNLFVILESLREAESEIGLYYSKKFRGHGL